MRLVWGKGIAAARNPKVVSTIEQRFRYTVRAAFTADFTCERERANAPCLPIRPMSVRFTAPVPRELAARLHLRPAAGGEPLVPVFDKDEKASEVSEVAFPKPLAENAAFTVEMPADLKDVAGRPLANASAFPLKVQTGSAPPIAKFAAAPFGIVERNADAVLPVTLHVAQRHRQHGIGVALDDAERRGGELRDRRCAAGLHLQRKGRGVGKRPAGDILEIGRHLDREGGVLRERLGKRDLAHLARLLVLVERRLQRLAPPAGRRCSRAASSRGTGA